MACGAEGGWMSIGVLLIISHDQFFHQMSGVVTMFQRQCSEADMERSKIN